MNQNQYGHPWDDDSPHLHPLSPHIVQTPDGVQTPLTVDDIVKLASAGVAITYSEIRHRIASSPPAQSEYPFRDPAELLLDVLRKRISANVRSRGRDAEGELFPYLAAAQFEETVYVFAHYPGHPPVVLTDPGHLYPSDALMAKLHLLKVQPKAP